MIHKILFLTDIPLVLLLFIIMLILLKKKWKVNTHLETSFGTIY